MTSTLFAPSQDFDNFSNFLKFSAIISDCSGTELSSVLNTFITKIITHTKLLNILKRNIIAFCHDLLYMNGKTELLKNILGNINKKIQNKYYPEIKKPHTKKKHNNLGLWSIPLGTNIKQQSKKYIDKNY